MPGVRYDPETYTQITHTHTHSLPKQLDKDIIGHGCQLRPFASSTTTPKCVYMYDRTETLAEMPAPVIENQQITRTNTLCNGGIETPSDALLVQLPKHCRTAVHINTRRGVPSHIITFLSINTVFTCAQHGVGGDEIDVSLSLQLC